MIDTATDTVVGEIADTPGVHGIAIAPALKRAFVSDGRANQVSIVDTGTLATLSKVNAGKNPDAIIYEAGQNEVYAFNGRSNSATVIAAGTGQVVATVPLPGKPEFAAADPAAGRVYNNLEDKNQVAVIDTKTHQVVAVWPIAPGESASGMALDAANHRLFLGCDNKVMIMMDSTTGKVVGSAPIGDGVDANAFDPGTGYAFSSNGEDGNVTVAHEDSPGQLTVVQTLETAPRARTMMVDPATHKIYLSTAEFVAPAANAPAPPRLRRTPAPAGGPGQLQGAGLRHELIPCASWWSRIPRGSSARSGRRCANRAMWWISPETGRRASGSRSRTNTTSSCSTSCCRSATACRCSRS